MKKSNNSIVVTVVVVLMHISAFSQREIALTIDDPTTKETPILKWQERDDIILKTLDKHKIKAYFAYSSFFTKRIISRRFTGSIKS